MPDEAHERDGHHEEQADRKREGEHQNGHPDAPGELLGILLPQLRPGGNRERLEADPERLHEGDHATQDRHPRELAQTRAFAELELLDGDLTEGALRGALGSRLPHGDRPMLDAAHHHALEDGLAAQGRIPGGGQAGFPNRRFSHSATAGSERLSVRRLARRSATLGSATLEALDAAAGIDKLLLAGVERMALGADLDVDLRLRRAGHEVVPARAGDVGLDVVGVNVGLHR